MAYALDLKANLAANYITGEFNREMVNGNWLFVMEGGVFYTKDLIVKNVVTGRELRPGLDYMALHLNAAATMQSGGKETSTIILIIDKIVTTVSVKRRVVGGVYQTIGSDIEKIITEEDINELNSTSWTQVLGAPYQLPWKNHTHYAEEVYGLEHVIQQLRYIGETIITGDERLFGMIYEYIDRLISTIEKKIDTELQKVKDQANSAVQASKVQPGMIVFFNDAVHPRDRFKFGTWERIPEDTFMFAVKDDANLGKKKKVGEGSSYLSTGMAGWILKAL